MSRHLARPAAWLLKIAVPREWRDSIAGDLEEECARRRARGQRAGAVWATIAAAAVSLRLYGERLRTRGRGTVTVPKRTRLDTVAADLRHAARGLARNRGFTLTAVLTLALGIGANAAVFTAAWHLLLKPLPWPEADRLVQIWNTTRPGGGINVLAPANYLDIEREATLFEATAAYTFFDYSLNLTGAGEPVETRVRAVTGDYFKVFGVAPQAGRTITVADADANAAVIVLGNGMWRRQFGADPDVLGRHVRLDDRRYEVIGVMPASFDPAVRPLDGWVPYHFTPELRERRLGFFLAAVGRLRPGVTPEQARTEVAAIAARATDRLPKTNHNVGATARPIRDEISGPLRTGVALLLTCAALVLLIACSNLTSLQLTRTGAMGRELAIRAAVGATRLQIMRLLLMESLLVALGAGTAGLLAGAWAVQAVAVIAPPSLAAATRLSLDPAVALATLAVSLTSALLVSSIAAVRATGHHAVDALRSRGALDHSGGRVRATLVTTEVAMATGLLVVALALVASFTNVMRVELGFDPTAVLIADLRLPSSRYHTAAQRAAFFDEVMTALRMHPAVESTCATNTVPFEQAGTMTYVPHGTMTLVGSLPVTVSADCFRTLRVRLQRGRLFEPRETEAVAIVSEGFARKAWPNQEAVGKVIHIGLPSGEPLTVVGVVADSRRLSLEAEPYAQVYQLAHQSEYFAPTRLLIRTSAAADVMTAAVAAAIRTVDGTQPVGNVRWLDEVVARSLSTRRFNLLLLCGFAVIAIALAAIGVYGLLTQLVAGRRAEIGLRMVLGAEPRGVVRLITRGILSFVAVGILLGLGGAWLGSRAVARFVFGVSATDPVLYAGASALVLVLATVASLVPIRRAMQIDPITVLRSE